MNAPAARAGLWARLRALLIAQLRQGATPAKLALTIAVAITLGLFPWLGATTVLCLLAGTALKLNHPVMQAVNYALSPVQIALMIPFWKAGEWLGAPHLSLSFEQLQAKFQAGVLPALREFGWIALGGIGAWCVAAPFLVAAIYFGLHPVLRGIARRRQLAAAAAGV